MPLADERIAAANPWWADPAWEQRDPHLRRLSEQPVRLPDPGFVGEVSLERPAIHLVRGPRQVGKSTGLKLLAGRALAAHPAARVAYLPLDLLEDRPIADVAATIARAKALAGRGATLLLLDEVTAVPRWARAVKALWDDGTVAGDVVVCTGSSAADLVTGGAEGLPGRRGPGRDFLVLPASFASFARATDPLVPRSPGLGVALMVSDQGAGVLRDAERLLPRLAEALERYLVFGGLPAAVADAVAGERVPRPETQRIMWDAIEREVIRKGASGPALAALLERVVRSLGSKTNWSALARDMDVPLGGRRTAPHHRSVRDYVDFLSRVYAIAVVYFWKPGADSGDLSRDKKLYFGDPLLHLVARTHAPGLAFDVAAAVENAVALTLLRCYEPPAHQAAGFTAPARIHVWESARGREIDFVCGRKGSVDLVEVKYRTGADRRDTLSMRNAFPSRPAVLVTRDTLGREGSCALVPAPLFLWALGEGE